MTGAPTERLAGTDFVIRSLPTNGRLYHYDESRTGKRGDEVAAGDSVTDEGELCASAPGWLCKRVLYEGERVRV